MKKKILLLPIIIICYFSGDILTNCVSASEKSHSHNTLKIPKVDWTFRGFFGVFKREQLQRGYQVYKEVCSTCHGIKRIYYRNLSALGFSEAAIKVLAAEHSVQDGPNAEGKMFDRPALPKDQLASPFANDNAARAANNGALPPDLSLIVKARPGGADYIYSILTGYAKPPAGFQIENRRYYNTYFPGNQISMPEPLHDHQITYSDDTVATTDQMARDVVTFLAWAAEPEMEERKQLGVKVFLYLLLMTGLFYATMRRIWSRVH